MAPLQFGILIIPFQILDVAGPLDILGSASQKVLKLTEPLGVPPELVAKGIDIQFHYIGETHSSVTVSAGLKVAPTVTFDTCPKLDYLLIGGPDPSFFQKIFPPMTTIVQERTQEVKTLFKTFKGAMVGAATG